ncbi:MAG TPA: hypothetical protein VFZ12_00020, partial [Dehalococcoidia bacterium]|nr:hypothetical protein [Dehalococcoidia bacterium]
SSSSESWLHGSTIHADLSPEEQDVAEIARLDAWRHRLLHWELEFPEVFFAPRAGTTQVVEQRPDPGFDAVIGNPPWIRQESIGKQKLALARS